MSAFVDPFEEADLKLEERLRKKQIRDTFLALYNKQPRTDEDRAALVKMLEDPYVKAMYALKNYYDLMQTSGSLSRVQEAGLKGVPEVIVKAYFEGKRQSMLRPWELYQQLRKDVEVYGIDRRIIPLMISEIEAKYPDYKATYDRQQGKGRRRTGRARRVRGRRRTTRRR